MYFQEEDILKVKNNEKSNIEKFQEHNYHTPTEHLTRT